MKNLLGKKSTISKWLRVFSVIMLFSSGSGGALGETVGFNPATNKVGEGDTFDIDIVGDFTELSGGVIDLGFDSAAVRINSVTIDPFFDFQPDGGGPAAGDTWPGIGFDVFANDPATGNFVIATINVTTLTSVLSDLTILGTSQFFSVTAQLSPTLNPGEIDAGPLVVPTPAEALLYGAGLLGLFGVAKRKAALAARQAV